MLFEKPIIDFCNNKKIILIGNSKRLIEKDRSKFIDSFDVIIRMNHAIPSKLIGKKTHIWICNYDNVSCQYVEYLKFKPRFIMRMNENNSFHFNLKSRAYIWPIEEYKQFRKLVNINKPSTGLSVIHWFITKVSAQINIVGFDSFETGTFYNPINLHKRYHEQEKEKEWINNLIREQRIIKYD